MESLQSVARLFGHLLLYELNAEMLTELSRGETRDALQELGIRVPAGAREDALAAEYFDCFVHPEAGAPPVASLWIDGDYGGSCRRDIERWAESVGFSFEPQSELAPVPDHLGEPVAALGGAVSTAARAGRRARCASTAMGTEGPRPTRAGKGLLRRSQPRADRLFGPHELVRRGGSAGVLSRGERDGSRKRDAG
jgi:hypothetical protein